MNMYQDHLGNTYKSFSQMCKAYHKNPCTVRQRIGKGETLETALTTGLRNAAIDHLGNTFKSFRAMCHYYNLSVPTVMGRLKRGYTLQKALETKRVNREMSKEDKNLMDICAQNNVCFETVRRRIRQGETLEQALRSSRKKITDHLGNTFNNVAELCKYWNIAPSKYRSRIAAGYDMKQALECSERMPYPARVRNGESSGGAPCVYKGKEYPNVASLARAYGIKPMTLYQRLHRGMTIEEAIDDFLFYDHEGNHYHSLSEMCAHWGISKSCFKSRINNGYNIKTALTEERYSGRGTKCSDGETEYRSLAEASVAHGLPASLVSQRLRHGKSGADLFKPSKGRGTPIKDHEGNEFPNLAAMCKAHGMMLGTVIDRLKRGLSLEEALSNRRLPKSTLKVTDHLGNEFLNTQEMCKAWGVSVATYRDRIKRGASLQEALTRKRMPKTNSRPYIEE